MRSKRVKLRHHCHPCPLVPIVTWKRSRTLCLVEQEGLFYHLSINMVTMISPCCVDIVKWPLHVVWNADKSPLHMDISEPMWQWWEHKSQAASFSSGESVFFFIMLVRVLLVSENESAINESFKYIGDVGNGCLWPKNAFHFEFDDTRKEVITSSW